jgi:hypothetical protein
LGSGKGRALLVASRFPFKKIVGVELSHQLHRTANRNIEVFHADWQRCTNLISVCENAATFELPKDNLVVYLYNPFDEHVLSTVVSRLEHSLSQYPRTIYIVYVKPAHRHLFDRSNWFSLTKTVNDNLIYITRSPKAA